MQCVRGSSEQNSYKEHEERGDIIATDVDLCNHSSLWLLAQKVSIQLLLTHNDS